MFRACCLILLLAYAQTTFASEPCPAKLEGSTQAIGWWMSSSGVIAALAGSFALAAPRPLDDGGRDLQFAGGIGLAGVGVALFTIGIIVLTTGEPGPCETSGTALNH